MSVQSMFTEKQCINVLKVFDWVNRFVNIRLKEVIEIKPIIESNLICCRFSIPCDGTRTTVWSGIGIKNLVGSITIRYCSGCDGTMDVIVNDKKLASLKIGQTFSATVNQLTTVEVQCNGQPVSGFCDGELQIKVHFDLRDENEIDIQNVKCFLSDREGNPLDPLKPGTIECKEISDPHNRRNVNITLPNGKMVILQIVEVLKTGFVTVQFFNKKGEIIKVCTFPFSEIERFFLCAPEGTTVDCEITDFQCKVHAIPSLNKSAKCIDIVISLDICQSVQTVGEVKLEIEGKECKPRSELEGITVCPKPKIPPQCPFIFT
ncbi:uncharacterized protein DUF3992 [Thermolongibacillus altinsuensis]|jgi:hypothetical protein|uniref:Uncharacterized protein DUF3992 n=2 Tax=Thermolongibacillus altinsuensis TaxID=575256 RepID=A0A4R1QAF9_9BACL|nr:uncharacterized protein DUF3992 [Thermolongibacillus altinsuensis]